MTDWNFIALMSMLGILFVSVLCYLAWEDYIYFKTSKNAIDKAIDLAKWKADEMDK